LYLLFACAVYFDISIYRIKRLFELEDEEHRGEGDCEKIRYRLGEVNRRRFHSRIKEQRNYINKRKQEHKLSHNSNRHRGERLAKRYEGHLAGNLYAKYTEHGTINTQRRRSKVEESCLRCENRSECARENQHTEPKRDGINKAATKEKLENSLYSILVFCTVVVAYYRLCALCKSLQRKHRKLHYARENSHRAYGNIAAISLKRGVKANRNYALARLHYERSKTERKARQSKLQVDFQG